MTPADVLREARKLVERGWTQGYAARDADDCPVMPWNSNAVRWCMGGALDRASGRSALFCSDCILLVQKAIGSTLIFRWNDAPGRTQGEVLDAIGRAIEIAEGAQP